MKQIIIIFIFSMFGLNRIHATAQYPDKLYYEGKYYSLFSNPLESYFEIYPDKRPRGGITSTALWRGYVATFEIRDNQLFLKDIEIEVQKGNAISSEFEWESVLHKVFPDSNSLKIDWYTGLLVLPYGKLVQYVHMGYGSTYKKYILLEINKGDFKQALKFNHKEYEKFKKKQFVLFKKTEKYKKLVEELKQNGETDQKFIDSFLENFVIEYSSEILNREDN